jgi:hypothetical protein
LKYVFKKVKGVFMIKGKLGIKIGVMCALVVGMSQATIITKSPSTTTASQGNTGWQDIKGVSYSYNDLDGNGQISVGETVTFSVTMEKTYWGTHDYDALKFWIDGKDASGNTTNLVTNTGIWDYDVSDNNMQYFEKSYDPYSYKPWTGGTNTFTFTYTFTTAGTYDITQSVMCSRDLSGLSNSDAKWDDNPTASDWKAWTENIQTNGTKGYKGQSLQGETERYSLTVTKSVPEPGTFSLIACGLMSLAGAAFFRRKKK